MPTTTLGAKVGYRVGPSPFCTWICLVCFLDQQEGSTQAGLPLSDEAGGYELSGLTSNTPIPPSTTGSPEAPNR